MKIKKQRNTVIDENQAVFPNDSIIPNTSLFFKKNIITLIHESKQDPTIDPEL